MQGKNPANKRLLISGGGIAGCTLAYFLKQKGFSPVVVELAPEFRRQGYLLALNEQIGQRVAEKMRLLDELREFEVPLTKNVMNDTSGRQLFRSESDHKTLNARVGMMLNRADLHFTLYSTVRDTVEFRMGQEIVAIEDANDGARVTFSSGGTESFDLVIGADGVHSRVRELIFGKGLSKHMGYAYFALVASDRKLRERIAENAAVVIRGDGFSIAYHRLQGSEIGAYIFHRENVIEKIALDQRRDHMLGKYGRFDATFKAILEGMKESEHVFHDGFTQIVMPAWHKGRVCLIGDAGFCPTPASGVGASMAMAAAYIVAKNLAETEDYKAAFADYDRYMRPYVKKAQSSAGRMLLLAAGGSIISYEFTNFLLRLIPGNLLGRLHSHAISMPLP